MVKRATLICGQWQPRSRPVSLVVCRTASPRPAKAALANLSKILILPSATA